MYFFFLLFSPPPSIPHPATSNLNSLNQSEALPEKKKRKIVAETSDSSTILTSSAEASPAKKKKKIVAETSDTILTSSAEAQPAKKKKKIVAETSDSTILTSSAEAKIAELKSTFDIGTPRDVADCVWYAISLSYLISIITILSVVFFCFCRHILDNLVFTKKANYSLKGTKQAMVEALIRLLYSVRRCNTRQLTLKIFIFAWSTQLLTPCTSD